MGKLQSSRFGYFRQCRKEKNSKIWLSSMKTWFFSICTSLIELESCLIANIFNFHSGASYQSLKLLTNSTHPAKTYSFFLYPLISVYDFWPFPKAWILYVSFMSPKKDLRYRRKHFCYKKFSENKIVLPLYSRCRKIEWRTNEILLLITACYKIQWTENLLESMKFIFLK